MRVAFETNLQGRIKEDGLDFAFDVIGEANPLAPLPAGEGGGIDARDRAVQLQPLARKTPQCGEDLAVDGLNRRIVGDEQPDGVGGEDRIRLPRCPCRLARAGHSDQHDESQRVCTT